MFTVDLTNTTDEEIKRLICDLCHEFGTVVDVTIERKLSTPVAVVKMSAPIEALRINREHNGAVSGTYATIALQQKGGNATPTQ